MTKEDYVSFEIAKLLKEKGFLKTVDLRMTQNLSFYDKIGLSHNLNKYYDRLIQEKIDFVVAPTLQMAMKWLREVHNIFLKVGFGIDYAGDFLFMADIYDLTNDAIDGKYVPTVEADDYLTENPKTYEQAVEAAIKYCLTNLI